MHPVVFGFLLGTILGINKIRLSNPWFWIIAISLNIINSIIYNS